MAPKTKDEDLSSASSPLSPIPRSAPTHWLQWSLCLFLQAYSHLQASAAWMPFAPKSPSKWSPAPRWGPLKNAIPQMSPHAPQAQLTLFSSQLCPSRCCTRWYLFAPLAFLHSLLCSSRLLPRPTQSRSIHFIQIISSALDSVSTTCVEKQTNKPSKD